MEERTEQALVQKRSSPLGQVMRGSERIDTWLNYIGMVFTVLLMLMTVFQVTARQLFNHPFKGYIDAEEMFMALLVFLSAAYCQLKGGNIRFEMFMTNVLKGGRAYHMAEVLYLLIALLYFAMIAIYSLKSAVHAYVINDVTLSSYWPTWPARMGAAIGSIFLCVRLIIQISQNTSAALTGAKITKET